MKKNLGDDLFLKIITDRYPKTMFHIQTPKKYNDSLYGKNITFHYNALTKMKNFVSRRTNQVIDDVNTSYRKKTDALVLLGGSMFIEKGMSNTQLSEQLFKQFTCTDKPYFILGSNFGPYKNNYYLEEYRKVFQNANDVCFRESYSQKLFKGSTRYAPDIVFSMDCNKYPNKNEKKVAFSVIDLINRPELSKFKESYKNKILSLINSFRDKGYKIILMSFCKAEGDEQAIVSILNRLDNKEDIDTYLYNGNIDEALTVISTSEYVVGTRFHATILGFLFRKKTLPIIYSDKTQHILDDLHFSGETLDIRNLQEQEVDISKIEKLVHVPSKEAEKHFEKLDQFLVEDNKNV